MPCYERVQITEVKLPKNLNQKYLLEGLKALNFEITNNVSNRKTLRLDGRVVGEITEKGAVELTDASVSSLVKQAYSVGIAKVEAKKKGLTVQKIEMRNNKVYMRISKKGGAW